jgi:ATP-dependent Lhr-like helicase
VVATASLELGIDIGALDLVYQLDSPKSVATGLQRIGRSGHLLDQSSKGRILAFDPGELMEAAAISRAMRRGEVDNIHLPSGCLDVLAQQIVGAVAAGDWTVDGLLGVFRQSFPYRDLSEEQFEAVLPMLAGDVVTGTEKPPRALLHWNRVHGRLTAARGAAHLSAMCVGTIPDSAEYDVIIEGVRKRVGRVPSDLVEEQLRLGDVFVLGSTCWKLVAVQNNRLYVQEAPGVSPTVPQWHGGGESRSREVGRRVGQLRRDIGRRLDSPGMLRWLQSAHCLSADAAQALAGYVRQQSCEVGFVSDHERILVELWRDELGNTSVIAGLLT